MCYDCGVVYVGKCGEVVVYFVGFDLVVVDFYLVVGVVEVFEVVVG